MPKYRVFACASIGIEAVVEADSEEDAIDKASDLHMPQLGVNPWARNGDRMEGYWDADTSLQFDGENISAEVVE